MCFMIASLAINKVFSLSLLCMGSVGFVCLCVCVCVYEFLCASMYSPLYVFD